MIEPIQRNPNQTSNVHSMNALHSQEGSQEQLEALEPVNAVGSPTEITIHHLKDVPEGVQMPQTSTDTSTPQSIPNTRSQTDLPDASTPNEANTNPSSVPMTDLNPSKPAFNVKDYSFDRLSEMLHDPTLSPSRRKIIRDHLKKGFDKMFRDGIEQMTLQTMRRIGSTIRRDGKW